jgi:hypothetical protein
VRSGLLLPGSLRSFTKRTPRLVLSKSAIALLSKIPSSLPAGCWLNRVLLHDVADCFFYVGVCGPHLYLDAIL